MEIAVTGANGFIAKNFIYSFVGNNRFNINKITRTTSKNQIRKILNKCEVLYHFAGVNRPNKTKTFKKDNFELTRFICDYLKKKLKLKLYFLLVFKLPKIMLMEILKENVKNYF